MVKIVMLFVFITIISSLNAQTDSKTELELGYVFDNPPLYKGGELELTKFIIENINYPNSAIDDSIFGIVYITLTVDTLGNITNYDIYKGIREDLNIEALRIAKLIKFEEPAKKRGVPVACKYAIAIRFILEKLQLENQ